MRPIVLAGRAMRHGRLGHGWRDAIRPDRIRWSLNATRGGAVLHTAGHNASQWVRTQARTMRTIVLAGRTMRHGRLGRGWHERGPRSSAVRNYSKELGIVGRRCRGRDQEQPSVRCKASSCVVTVSSYGYGCMLAVDNRLQDRADQRAGARLIHGPRRPGRTNRNPVPGRTFPHDSRKEQVRYEGRPRTTHCALGVGRTAWDSGACEPPPLDAGPGASDRRVRMAH